MLSLSPSVIFLWYAALASDVLFVMRVQERLTSVSLLSSLNGVTVINAVCIVTRDKAVLYVLVEFPYQSFVLMTWAGRIVAEARTVMNGTIRGNLNREVRNNIVFFFWHRLPFLDSSIHAMQEYGECLTASPMLYTGLNTLAVCSNRS
jgi:hypothetical protein